VTVDPDHEDGEVVDAFRSEVAGWQPRRVPDLVELTGRVADSWQRPVMLASALGAAGLAIVLLLSLAVVLAAPTHIGWAGTVKDHLTAFP
jgi:hypothetical protein